MPHLSLSLLGAPITLRDGQPLTGFESGKVWALLVYLLVERAQPHSRDALTGLLWPEQPDPVARHNLRQSLANLRHVLGDRTANPPFLIVTRAAVQFNPACDVDLDVAAFEAYLTQCEQHAHRQAEMCDTCAEWRQQALALYRGDFLDGFYVRDSVAYDEWALLKREGVRRQALAALGHLAAYHQRRENYPDAEAALRRLVALDPLQEAGHRDLMRVLAISGQRNAALEQYARCVNLLQTELGVPPEAETTSLYERILAGGVSVPERGRRMRSNLPIPSTPLIGRGRDMAALRELMQQGHTRLLTLIGPPGIGKTRLALAIANALRSDFDDGVFFVALAPLHDAALVPMTIAQVLGVHPLPNVPLSQLLQTALQDRALLLVLDNFEHVVEAAPLVADLLEHSSDLTILATSRRPLNVYAERVWPVAPLALPAPTDPPDWLMFAPSPAVALFVERAQAALPQFALTPDTAASVVQICRELDGLPLAIELAATRVRVLPPPALLARLDSRLRLLTGGSRDLPVRHQTLRAAIEWSYNLLTAEEKALFQRLAVFVGGCTLDAVAAVAGGEANPAGALADTLLDTVQSLVANNLVQQADVGGEPRLTLLETIREYALERLVESGESDWVRRQHAAFFLALAERAEPELRGPDQLAWLTRLEQEHANLRAALEWTLATGREATTLGLSSALWWFWNLRGYWSEGRRWLEAALKSGRHLPMTNGGDAQRGDAVYAKALWGAGVLAWLLGESEAANARLEASQVLWRRLGDERGLAYVLSSQAIVAWSEGHVEQARSLAEGSRALFQATHDAWGLGYALNVLGEQALRQDNPARAFELCQQSLVQFRRVGDRWGIALALNWMGLANLDQANYPTARLLLEEALGIYREIGDKWFIAQSLNRLGEVARSEGDYERAGPLYEESLRLFRELGFKWGRAMTQHNLGYVALWRGDTHHASALFGRSLTLNIEREDKQGIGSCLAGLAAVAQRIGKPTQAARLYGSAEAVFQASGKTLAWADRREWDAHSEAIRADLGALAFDAAWAAGQALSLEAAIAEARTVATLAEYSLP